MSIKTTISRDENGFPSLVKLSQGSSSLEMVFDKDSGFQINGSRRSLDNLDLWKALSLIYPSAEKISFDIPQPLQVSQIGGGDVLLFDDMEGLLKWVGGFGGTALDNAYAFNGSQSLVMNVAAGGTIEQASRRFATVDLTKKVIVETKFSVDVLARLEDLTFIYYVSIGSNQYQATVIYTPATRIWTMTSGGADVPILTLPRQLDGHTDVSGTWHNFKMVIDLADLTLKELRVNPHIVTLNLPLQRTAGATVDYSQVTVVADNVAGQEVNVWIDDFKVWQE